MDVLLGNGLGLLTGMLAVRWFNMHPYDWTGRDRKHPLPMSPLAQGGMVLRQLLPAEFARYEWKIFHSSRHLLAAGLLVLFMEVVELNAFFLKYVLYMPPATPFNAYRLVLWFLLALPATREYYAYATDPHVQRLGPNCWLAIVVMVVEVMVVVKFGAATAFPPDAGIPPEVLACWGVAAGAFLVWCLLKFSGGSSGSGGGGGGGGGGGWLLPPLGRRVRPTVMNLLISVTVGALGYLAWSQDAGLGRAIGADGRPR